MLSQRPAACGPCAIWPAIARCRMRPRSTGDLASAIELTSGRPAGSVHRAYWSDAIRCSELRGASGRGRTTPFASPSTPATGHCAPRRASSRGPTPPAPARLARRASPSVAHLSVHDHCRPADVLDALAGLPRDDRRRRCRGRRRPRSRAGRDPIPMRRPSSPRSRRPPPATRTAGTTPSPSPSTKASGSSPSTRSKASAAAAARVGELDRVPPAPRRGAASPRRDRLPLAVHLRATSRRPPLEPAAVDGPRRRRRGRRRGGHRASTGAQAAAYARRARGQRKRPHHGWASLTPTEQQVVDTRRPKGSPTPRSPNASSWAEPPSRPTSSTSSPSSASAPAPSSPPEPRGERPRSRDGHPHGDCVIHLVSVNSPRIGTAPGWRGTAFAERRSRCETRSCSFDIGGACAPVRAVGLEPTPPERGPGPKSSGRGPLRVGTSVQTAP